MSPISPGGGRLLPLVLLCCALLFLASCGTPNSCSDGSALPAMRVSLQVVGNTVYLGMDRQTTRQDAFYALDARTGTVRWQNKKTGSSSFFVGDHSLFFNNVNRSGCTGLALQDGSERGRFPSCDLLQDGILYADANDLLFAIDTRIQPQGKLLWKTTFPASEAGDLLLDHGILFSCTRGQIVALRASDGRQLWTFTQTVGTNDVFVNAQMSGENVLYTVGTPTGSWIYALRGRDGTVLWRYGKPYFSDVTVGPDGVVYANSGQSDMDVTTLDALDARTGARLWTFPRQVVTHAPFAITGAFYFEDTSGVYALRSSDGKVLWKTPQEEVIAGMGDDTLYVWLTETDDNILAALNARDGSTRWKAQLPAGFIEVVADGVLYLSTIASAGCDAPQLPGAFAVRARDGKVLWRFQEQHFYSQEESG